MAPSPPTSPPAKRPKLDSDLPASLSSPARSEGKADVKAEVTVKAVNGSKEVDEDSSDEEQEPAPPEQDFSRSDMYLDTVS